MSSPDHCPAAPERTAEAYLLGNLSLGEARAFDGHCINCSRCAAILAYVVAMKQEKQGLRGFGEVDLLRFRFHLAQPGRRIASAGGNPRNGHTSRHTSGGGAASTFGAEQPTIKLKGGWWALKDLNLRPTDYESAALTAELRARSIHIVPAGSLSCLSAERTSALTLSMTPFRHRGLP